MLNHSLDRLSRAVLQTVAYSDIFDHPLTAREIHRYLIGRKASLEEVAQAVRDEGIVTRTGDYFTLPGREEIVRIRMQREAHSRKLLPQAIQYGRMLGSLPYIRMVALTGSLAVMNVSDNHDFDYMLVTAPGRVWTARAFALALNRFARLRGHTLCPNLIISTTALRWRVHDLYSARELCHMKLLKGQNVYIRLMKVNEWIGNFLPNAFNMNAENNTESDEKHSRNSFLRKIRVERFQYVLETLLRGRFSDRLEQWEMSRKIARFSKQAGYGEETIFTAEICQGNFHHHRQWTKEEFEKRLSTLAAVPGSEVVLT